MRSKPRGKSDRERPARFNALAWALGRFVKAKRKPKYGSSKELAGFLGLPESSYRLVEAGGAILQPRHCRRLLQALDSHQIAWPRLASLVLAARLLEDQPEDGDSVLAWLNKTDPSIKPLTKVLSRTASTPDEEHERQVVHAVSEYLRDTRPTQGEPFAKKLESLAETLDPLLLAHHLQAAAELSRLRPTITSEGLNAWEKLNAARFNRVVGLIFRLNIEEWTDFDWPFLHPQHSAACVVLLSRTCLLEDIGKLELLMADKAGVSVEDLKEGRSEHRIHVLSSREEALVRDKLGELGLRTEKTNYWIYEIALGLPGPGQLSTLAVATRDEARARTDRRRLTALTCGVVQSHLLLETVLDLEARNE